MSYAGLRGHRVFYQRQGESGPRVLLVMGFGMSGAGWRHQADDLQADHQVVWYDNRGIGKSSAGVGGGDLEDLADDAVGLLDHLRWPDAHVVGVSMGGMVAQHLALRRRPRVRSLTLIATHPGGWRAFPRPEGLFRFLQANTSKGAARMQALSKLLFSPPHREALAKEGWSPEELAQFAAGADPKVRLQQLLGILRHDTRDRLHTLAGLPVLVVRPGGDRLVHPWGSDELHRRVPGATLLDLPHAYHGANAEDPARVNAAIRALIRRAEAASG